MTDPLTNKRTYELALQGVTICRNCDKWLQPTCPNAPSVKWYQRKVDLWCKLSTCDQFSPDENTQLALMHLTQRKMLGEDIQLELDHEDDEPEEVDYL